MFIIYIMHIGTTMMKRMKYLCIAILMMVSTLLPELSGTINDVKTFYDVDEMINVNYSSIPTGTHHWRWQYYSGSSWVSIGGATAVTYKPTKSYAGKYLRLRLTVDGYTGELYSNTVKVNPYEGVSLLKGDVDFSGKVDSTDYIMIKRIILGIDEMEKE